MRTVDRGGCGGRRRPCGGRKRGREATGPGRSRAISASRRRPFRVRTRGERPADPRRCGRARGLRHRIRPAFARVRQSARAIFRRGPCRIRVRADARARGGLTTMRKSRGRTSSRVVGAGVNAFAQFAALLSQEQLEAVGAFWSPSKQRYTPPADHHLPQDPHRPCRQRPWTTRLASGPASMAARTRRSPWTERICAAPRSRPKTGAG